MRIDEVEPKKQLSEAPLGAWSSMGNRLLSRMSGVAPTAAARAGGKVETGHIANVLHAQFQKFVGATGIKPSAKDVIDFLKRKGFPIEGASQILKQVDPTISAGTPSAPQSQPTTTTTSQSLPPKTQSTQTTQPNSPEAIRKAKQAAATKNVQAQMAPFSPMPDKNQAAGQQAFSNMAGGLEKMGNKPAVTTLPPGSKQLGPKGRETLARLGKQKQDRESGNQGTLDLNEAIPGELSQGIIDKALLKAAQEFVLKGGQQGQSTSNVSVNDTEPEGNYAQPNQVQSTPTDVSTKIVLKQVMSMIPKLNAKQLTSLKTAIDKAVASKQQSISIGGQKIDPSDPLYAKMSQAAGK